MKVVTAVCATVYFPLLFLVLIGVVVFPNEAWWMQADSWVTRVLLGMILLSSMISQWLRVGGQK